MRYIELLEKTAGEKVNAATEKRHDAMHAYQDRMREIPKTTPAPQVGAKQAKARKTCQTALSRADDAARDALKPG